MRNIDFEVKLAGYNAHGVKGPKAISCGAATRQNRAN